MLVVQDISLFTFLRLVGKYAKGLYYRYPELIRHFRGQSIHDSSREELVSVVDGEVVRSTEFTVKLSEKKINFFYPAGASYAPAAGNVREREECEMQGLTTR